MRGPKQDAQFPGGVDGALWQRSALQLSNLLGGLEDVSRRPRWRNLPRADDLHLPAELPLCRSATPWTRAGRVVLSALNEVMFGFVGETGHGTLRIPFRTGDPMGREGNPNGLHLGLGLWRSWHQSPSRPAGARWIILPLSIDLKRRV